MVRYVKYKVIVFLEEDYAEPEDFEEELEQFNEANKGVMRVEYKRLS